MLETLDLAEVPRSGAILFCASEILSLRHPIARQEAHKSTRKPALLPCISLFLGFVLEPHFMGWSSLAEVAENSRDLRCQKLSVIGV